MLVRQVQHSFKSSERDSSNNLRQNYVAMHSRGSSTQIAQKVKKSRDGWDTESVARGVHHRFRVLELGDQALYPFSDVHDQPAPSTITTKAIPKWAITT